MFSIYSMSNQRNKTFRLSFIRQRITSLCQSRALRAALIAALEGPDAALVVDMTERVRPPSRLPMQVVTPVPQLEEEEETSEEEPDTPAQQGGSSRQEGSDQTPPQENRNTGEDTVIIIEDSDSDSDSSF